MAIKKYSSGQWVDTPYRKYGTETVTITSLPQTIIGDGQPISSYTIKGNMVQSGTPTPTSPIYPSECGERTENLCPTAWSQGGIDATTGDEVVAAQEIRSDYILVSPNGIFSIKRTIATGYIKIRFYDSSKNYIGPGDSTRVSVIYGGEGSTPTNPMQAYYNFCCIQILDSNICYMRIVDTSNDLSTLYMFTEGNYTPSTIPLYEPYGYKLPITLGSNTYPVYLSEPIRKISTYVDSVLSTGTASRVIKKLLLTGEENWQESSRSGGYRFVLGIQSALQSDTTVGAKSYCSHFKLVGTGQTYALNNAYTISGTSELLMTLGVTERLADFTTYLANQYTNGTPVTLWYALATATTETFTAPSIPTSGTAESFDVDTALKPSEVSLTYHGWHEHSDTKFT